MRPRPHGDLKEAFTGLQGGKGPGSRQWLGGRRRWVYRKGREVAARGRTEVWTVRVGKDHHLGLSGAKWARRTSPASFMKGTMRAMRLEVEQEVGVVYGPPSLIMNLAPSAHGERKCKCELRTGVALAQRGSFMPSCAMRSPRMAGWAAWHKFMRMSARTHVSAEFYAHMQARLASSCAWRTGERGIPSVSMTCALAASNMAAGTAFGAPRSATLADFDVKRGHGEEGSLRKILLGKVHGVIGTS